MARLTVLLLGTAAGGGYPQWNCRCPVCRLAWESDPRVSRRSQTSLAVSADGRFWTIINAAPEITAQIAATKSLWSFTSQDRGREPMAGADAQQSEVRGSPISAVMLTGGEVDQTAGLLSLREGHRFDLLATVQTHALLAGSPIFDVLDRDLVRRRAVGLGDPIALPGGMEAELFSVPGKVPLYLEAGRETFEAEPEGNVGVALRAGAARVLFVPGAAAVDDALRARLSRADIVLFDGTVFHDDEMQRCGAGTKSGRRMGHMPIDGPDGSLAALQDLTNRRIYIHINNTNPVLVDGSPERRAVEAAGWEIAHDGMRIEM